MARIKLDMPAVRLATINIPVRITDINYGNHVGNDSYVGIIHEARLQWLTKNGFSEFNVGGAGLIMGDLALEFKQEAFYGDNITVEIYAGETARASFELYYRLSTTRNGQTILLAHAKTGMIAYNYTTRKTISLTEEITRLLAGQSA